MDLGTWVWLDLEMTGLDPDRDVILEAGVMITGPDLDVRAELARVVMQPESALAGMDPFVLEMHTRNGLLDRVRREGIPLARAETELLDVVKQHCGPGQGILAGNSVHFDRTFIARYMPSLVGHLHHRHVDVSTLKVLTQAWFPSAPRFEKPTRDHTTLADLRLSIAELAHYRRLFFHDPSKVEHP